MEKGQQARALFESGCANCAQSVLCAFAPEIGLNAETLSRLACGFGGGVARMRGLCGAVSGMCMAAGMLRGYGLSDGEADKARTYAFVQSLVHTFEAHHGTTVCHELLGGNVSDAPTPTPRTAQFYATRPCGGLIASAADILQAALEAEGEE